MIHTIIISDKDALQQIKLSSQFPSIIEGMHKSNCKKALLLVN